MATIIDLYCRVSGDPQEDGTSLDEQERAGREYCAANGLIVGMVHREVHSGYYYRERKKLSAMRERYRSGKIQGIVIYVLDRLSRNQTHMAVLMEETEHYNVTIHCVKEKIDTSPMGKFVIAALALVAEMEREKIIDRTLTGRVNRAKEGKVVSGSKPLYGWQWAFDEDGEKDCLVLHEEQAKVLQRAAEDYAAGLSLDTITQRLMAEGVPSPRGKFWHPRTLRRTLTDPRMTGQNVKIFSHPNKRAKQHLEPVELPAGTYPRILSDELYEKVMERATTNAALSNRNSRHPERFLLRAGFLRCAYCGYAMQGTTVKNNTGVEYPRYDCPNPTTKCRNIVPSERLDAEVWATVAQLADHINLLEQSIELAMQNHTVDDELQAVENTMAEWQAKVNNYEEDLQDSRLRGDTRAGIRNLLNGAHEMVERLQKDRAELLVFSIDRDREREEYEKVLRWCKKIKSEREELSYTEKRDFLRMIGAKVIVERVEKRRGPVKWDIKVSLPEVADVIYQGRVEEIAGPLLHRTLCCIIA